MTDGQIVLEILQRNVVLGWFSETAAWSDDMKEEVRRMRARIWPHQPPMSSTGRYEIAPGQVDRRSEERRKADRRNAP